MNNARLTRRRFVSTGLAAAAGLGFGPLFRLRDARAQDRPGRTLVCVFLRGAVDGLHMVVPHGDARYYDLRGEIAIPRPHRAEGVLDLDGFFGLHPAMEALAPLFSAGELAVVHACGSPDPSRSHFDAQTYMETGTPGDKSTEDGWMNRHLQTSPAAAGQNLRAIAVTGNVPRSLLGPAPTYAASSLIDLDLGRGRQGSIARQALADLYADRDDLIGATVDETLANYDLFRSLGGNRPGNGAVYPAAPLGRQLSEVATVLKAGIGVEMAFLEVGGWDTHVDQGASSGSLADLLRALAEALAAFSTDMGSGMEDVCVITLSEFGRTAAVNGAGGTDHGRATAMLALGGTVRGGRVFGRWPGLRRQDLFEGRDLAVTTDFRTLLAEVVEGHLGNPRIEEVFPGFDDTASSPLGVMTGA